MINPIYETYQKIFESTYDRFEGLDHIESIADFWPRIIRPKASKELIRSMAKQVVETKRLMISREYISHMLGKNTELGTCRQCCITIESFSQDYDDVYDLLDHYTETLENYAQIVYEKDGNYETLFNMISMHSIVGNAYINAVRNQSRYDKDHNIIALQTVPENIIYYLEDLVSKYVYYGYYLDEEVYELMWRLTRKDEE